MTIVAGVSDTFEAVLIADCRLSVLDSNGDPIVVRDICQKLVAANGWSVVGFAGHLCLARHLLGSVVSRLRRTPHDAPHWLNNDQELLRFIDNVIRSHVRQVADHRSCQRQPVELLIAWMDYTRSIFSGDDQPFVPGTELIVIRTPQMAVNRTRFGIEIIGSGAVIADRMRDEAMMKIVNFARGHEYGRSHRCVFASVVVRDLLSKVGVSTVGGLYQIASLGRQGAEVVPYMYWAPVEPGYGTYVAMRIEDGYWVQERRPTGTKIKVLSPFEIQLRGPGWQRGKHEMFDPARLLTRHSPGVLPETNPRIEAHLYDPDNVPDAIRASWGDDPLPPLTWAE